MSASPPPGNGIPPLPLPGPAPTPTPRRLGEVAALVSAVTAVIGLLLGFFGLPTVVNSPTARTVTVTETIRATATVTVTASPPGQVGGTAESPRPAPLPSGEVPLRDLTSLGPFDSGKTSLSSVTMGRKAYSNAMVFRYPCSVEGLEYSINQRYKTLTLTVGLDDNSVAKPGKLSISGDGRVRKNVMLEINHPQTVSVDISNVIRLNIQPDISEPSSCDGDGVVIALADAVLRS